MIAGTLRGLGALALIALALIGWPAALLGLTDAVAVWLPDLSDPAALLSRPDTGGLFLVIVLALGWIAWAVWTVAVIAEVAAQIRGVPTPPRRAVPTERHRRPGHRHRRRVHPGPHHPRHRRHSRGSRVPGVDEREPDDDRPAHRHPAPHPHRRHPEPRVGRRREPHRRGRRPAG
ncbi:MAG: hypothetical protein WCF36_02665 [Candidatus Nanopelagicales bacterium]